MTGLSNESLWRRIQDYQFDKDGVDLTFTQRLARENRWPFDFARRVTDEYKRFIYLVCTTEGVLTPSQEVDQVWHLHLIYTRDYWERFCRETLERDLHHTPTEGGRTEADKFLDAYRRSFTRYVEEFGDHPPTDIWPDERARFAGTRVMVDPITTVIFPKSQIQTVLGLTVSGALAAGGIAAFSLGSAPLGWMLMFMSVVFVMVTLSDRIGFSSEANISIDGCGGGGCGGCGGCD